MVHSMDNEGVGVNHKVNYPKDQSQWQWGCIKLNKLSDWPKTFSKSCYRIKMKIFYWLTYCLIHSDKHNLTIAKATYNLFCCSMSLEPERCLLPYHCTSNVFFMDLPVSYFVSHLSFAHHKNGWILTWWLLFLKEIVCNFHSGYFRCSFNQFLIWITV